MSISVVQDNTLTVQAGSTAVISAVSNLAVNDTEYPDSAITYTITTPPSRGTLLKNEIATSSFTQADLDNGLISYREPTLSLSALSDSFFFKASDPGGHQTATTLFQINITPISDTPVDLQAPGSLTVFDEVAAAIRNVQLIDEGVRNSSYTITITANSGLLFATKAPSSDSPPATMSGWGTSSLTLTGSYNDLANNFFGPTSVIGSLAYRGTTAGADTITISVTGADDHTTVTKTINVDVKPSSNFATIDDPSAATLTFLQSHAYAINNAGQIIVNQSVYSGGNFAPFNNGQTPNAAPLGLNDAGDFVGLQDVPNTFPTSTNGFILHNGTFTTPSAPANKTTFTAINNNGVVVGYYFSQAIHQNGPSPVTGFIYDGAYHVIGPSETQPYGINDAGQVVGQVTQGSQTHAFIYANGIFSLLDDPIASGTHARDVNNVGDVVGYFDSASGTHGFAYSQSSGQWTPIDVPGATATFVYGVNDLHQIVGAYTDGNNQTHGFVGSIPPPLPAVAGNVDEWLLSNGKWEASAAPGSHPAGSHVAATADFTGDGVSDILWQNVNTGAVDLWKIANGGWAGSVDLGAHPGSGWQIAGSGDFNHDGASDVFWFNATTGDTDIWQLANGQWSASVSPGPHPLGYQVAGIGDFNRDGTSDVLWFNPTTRDVDEWNISNGHWAGSNDIGAYPSAGYQLAGVGDFNNDGTSDVFWYNPTTGATDIWLLQNGKWSASVSPGNHPTGWSVAGIGDFNGDGTSDVLWFNPTTRDTEEWIVANGHWAATNDLGVHPGGAQIAGIGDFNGSLVSDVLWHQFV
jgi:probable HAF family extracellular repeat protein